MGSRTTTAKVRALASPQVGLICSPSRSKPISSSNRSGLSLQRSGRGQDFGEKRKGPVARALFHGVRTLERYTLNDDPQPQVLLTFGLSNLNPAPSRVSR